MLTTLLFVTAFALPPTDNLVHLDLQLEGWVGYNGVGYSGAVTLPTGLVSPSLRNVYGGGEVDATFYLHPLHDDDAPPPYQAFLQRAAAVALTVGGSGASGFYVGPQPDGEVEGERRHWSFASASIGGYPLSWLHLATGLNVRDDYSAYDLNVSETLNLTPWASAGVRFHDALLSVGYQVPVTKTQYQGSSDQPSVGFHVPFAGEAYFQGSVLIARRSELDLSVALTEHGAQASGSGSVYFGRRFAVDLGVSGGSTRQNDAADAVVNAGASVGFTWWVMSRAGAHVGYQGTWWNHNDGAIEQEHVVLLALRTRPY